MQSPTPTSTSATKRMQRSACPDLSDRLPGYGIHDPELEGASAPMPAAAAPQVARQPAEVSSPRQEPKPPSKGKRSLEPKVGSDDGDFVRVWDAHRRAHEKWDANGIAAEDGAFGIAGVGRRDMAWRAWTALPSNERAAAARHVDDVIAWRQRSGYKLQQVRYYLTDLEWRKFSASAAPSFTSSRAASPSRSAADPSTDYWIAGVRSWLRTGGHALIPGGLNPDDLAMWPEADRETFMAKLSAILESDGAAARAALKRRAPAVLVSLQGEPVTTPAIATDRREVGLAAAQRQAVRAVKADTGHRTGRMSQDAVDAYCEKVGVSPVPDRYLTRH